MSEVVTIATFRFVAEADLVRAAIEQAGIEVFMVDDNLVAMDWLLANAIGDIKLQVAPEDAESALQIVDSCRNHRATLNANAPEVIFACENCGGTLKFPGLRRGGVETCIHCGEYVDVPE